MTRDDPRPATPQPAAGRTLPLSAVDYGLDAIPRLVILPGLDGTGRRLGDFVAALGGVEVAIIAYPPDRPLGYGALETLVRDALPRHRRFVLLAESFSGPLAIRIAAAPPPALCGLVLCSSFAQYPLAVARRLRAVISRIHLKSLPRWLRAPLLWGSPLPRDAPAPAARASAGVLPGVLQHRLEAVLRVDAAAAAAQIRVPVLQLRARRDWLVPRSASRRIARAIAHSELIEIDGPHLLLQTRATTCAAATLVFLRACGAAAQVMDSRARPDAARPNA